MRFSLNTASLIGEVSRFGVKLVGKPPHQKATCALRLVEEGADGLEHQSYVNVEIWGREGAQHAAALSPGVLVLASGTIKPVKRDEQWTLVIAARELELLELDPVETFAISQG